jgi:tripartite-type tricarboxylate transporter receptor subunit TctC
MNREKLRVRFVVGMSIFFFSALLVLPHAVWCEYPERPIRFIVGMDPGGPADLLARAAAVGLGKYLGKQLFLENRGGGGGALAHAQVANAKPDGYTLCTTNNGALIEMALLQKVPYKPLKSFTSVGAFCINENCALVVKPDSPLKNFNDFKDYAKKNPGKFKYSTPGVGSTVHTAMEVVAHDDGLKLVHVPHKGSAPAMTALLGGHVDAASAGSQWVNYAKGGQVRPLVSYARKRVPGYPDLPTLKELGYDFVHDFLAVIIGPAGLPADVVKKLEAALKVATETAEFKTVLATVERDPFYCTGAELDQHLKERWLKLEKRFKDMGVIKEAATEPY